MSRRDFGLPRVGKSYKSLKCHGMKDVLEFIAAIDQILQNDVKRWLEDLFRGVALSYRSVKCLMGN
ncbi:MAG: hypothetical protein SVY53_00705 [Chloroflexota bacterium]|nr:hypothetical protein [Chloroflexota bacterium]